MKHFVILCCVLASVAAKEKKVSLEDIEKDNLRTQKIPPPPQQKPVNSPTDYGFLPIKTATDYARQQPKQVQYIPSVPAPVQYPTVPQQYYYQQQQQPQYDNVQYVTDNNIAQQQYYSTPQYVYLQQYTAPSTAIQTVVDPKGGIQYIMYVPAYPTQKTEQTQNYENVVYANEQPTYPQYVSQEEQVPEIKYAPEVPPKQEFVPRSEPKSLLDSYVPSYLQIQYYKQQQQQAQANAITQSEKDLSSPLSGKIDYIKNYRPQQSYNSAESILNYSYLSPNTYRKYAN